ncbi:MAG: OmpH family outer membrane protein [Rhodospirillaceae bacterium]|nr:OmpH family outer membrane protein [Rhodospirillaceae bacterium]
MTTTHRFTRTTAAAMLAGLVLVFGASGSFAQAEKRPTPVLGIVDTDLLLQDSLAAKGVRLERDKYAGTYQNQVKDMEGKLRAEDQELSQQRSVLAPDVFQQRAQAFQQKLQDFQTQVKDKQERLDYSFQQSMQKIGETIMVVASEVSKEKGINAVMARNQLMIFDPGMDITKPVLEKLNQRMSSVEFKDPESWPRNAEGAAPAGGAAPKPAAAAPAKK